MKKRKISGEKNSEYRGTSVHSSVANLKATNTNPKRSRSAKSLSVHNLDLSKEIARPKDNRTMLPDEMQPPKTRFTSRDRSKETHSSSSPRLKSFPAEKIKKLNNSLMFTPEPINALIMQQEPRETGTSFMNSSTKSNNGHGDAMFPQLSSVHQQTKPQNTFSISQQQIVTNRQQICQANPHSESLLTRQILSTKSPERQLHRPFVPNVFQGTVNPPTIINQPVIIQSSSTQIPQQASSDSHALINQNHNKATALDNTCEKQPIGGLGGRSVTQTKHNQMFVQMQQQKQEAILRDAKTLSNNCSANDCQNIYYSQLHKFHQNSQQSPRNAYHQQIPQHMIQQQHYNNLGTCCNHCNRQLSAAQTLGQGMTSPQDVTVSQMRLMQRNSPIYPQNYEYPVNSPPVWSQNNGWLQATNQQHLHQPLPQWQYYYQMPTAQNMNFNQQNQLRNQSQPDPLRNQTNYKSTERQPAVAACNRQDGVAKETLQFTPEMIRDQELLVSTMRQQGVPDQVMQRQFDALLNEQRRHLAYVAQFQQREDIAEVKRIQLARRRMEKNEKPEWMVHITPPRISYNEIERMETQIGAKEQCLTDGQSPEEMSRIMAAQKENYNKQKEAEIRSNHQVVSPRQMYLRMNPHQQLVSWAYRNNHQIPYGYAGRYLYNHQQNAPNNAYYQPSPSFNDYIQYSCNMPYNHPYHLRTEQEIQAEKHNLSASNSIDPAHFYQQRLIEPSSLLKMRVYKEVICPQKRNNGLQDPRTVQKALEALKDPASKRGLQYLANLAKKKPVIKLNGTQNPNEIPEDMRSPVEIVSQSRKEISANGLENTRKPNNPPPRILRPKRADEPKMMEYPRQNIRTCYNVQAEKENGEQRQNSHATAYAQDAGSIPYDPQNASTALACHGNNTMIFQHAPSQYCHQMQRCYLNRQNLAGHNDGQGDGASMRRPEVPSANRIDRADGDNAEESGAEETTKRINDTQAMQGTNGQWGIREARSIGGITYLASKPEYGINNLVVSPNKLIANRHLQPPRIF